MVYYCAVVVFLFLHRHTPIPIHPTSKSFKSFTCCEPLEDNNIIFSNCHGKPSKGLESALYQCLLNYLGSSPKRECSSTQGLSFNACYLWAMISAGDNCTDIIRY